MKKLFSITVCSIIAAMSLCACGEKDSAVTGDTGVSASPVAVRSEDYAEVEDTGSSGNVVIEDGQAVVVYDELPSLGNYDVIYLYGTGYCFPHDTFDLQGFRDWLVSNEFYHSSFRLLIDSGKWYEDPSGARFFCFGDEEPYMYGAKLGDFTGCSYRDLVDRDGNPRDFKVQDETVYECSFGKFYAAF